MESLLKTIQEKLVINKHSKVKKSLSFEEFINMLKTRSIEIHGKTRSFPKSHLKAVFNKFNKDVENFKYKFISDEYKNHWKYKMCFEYCDKLLKNREVYKSLSDVDVIAIAYPIEIFGHINYSLDDSDDEYYVFYINLDNQTYEIYEVIK